LLKGPGLRDEVRSVASYKGSLRIPNTRDAVDAVFDIGDDHVRVTTGSELLGDWPLSDVAVEDRGDALLVSLGSESVLVDIGDRDGFSAALAPAPTRRRGRKSRRPMSKSGPSGRNDKVRHAKKPAETTASAETVVGAAGDTARSGRVRPRINVAEKLEYAGDLFSIDNWREWLQDRTVRWVIAAMGVVLFATLALFAADTLGMMLVLVGMLTLIVAAFAVSEDFQAHRIMPDWISESGLIIAGAVCMIIGGLLIVIG
jgi:hypothetical protein